MTTIKSILFLLLFFTLIPASPIYAQAPPLPAPPSQEEINKLREMGNENLRKYGNGSQNTTTLPTPTFTPAPTLTPTLTPTITPSPTPSTTQLYKLQKNFLQFFLELLEKAGLWKPGNSSITSIKSTDTLKTTINTYLPEASVSYDSGGIQINTHSKLDSHIVHAMVDICSNLPADSQKVTLSFREDDKATEFDCLYVKDVNETLGTTTFAIWDLSYQDSVSQKLYGEYTAALQERNSQEQIRLSQKLVDTNDMAPSWYELGYSHFSILRNNPEERVNEAQHLKESATALRTAIQKDPRFAPAYASLANVLFLQSSSFTDEVTSLYKKAQELDPKWSFGFMNQGVNLSYLNRPLEAYPYFKKAVEANPLFPDQEYIMDQFICNARQSQKFEDTAFNEKYGIDYNKKIAWCPH